MRTICRRNPQMDMVLYCPVYTPEASTWPMFSWIDAWSLDLMTLFVAVLEYVTYQRCRLYPCGGYRQTNTVVSEQKEVCD